MERPQAPDYADILRWDDMTLLNWHQAAREWLTSHPNDIVIGLRREAAKAEIRNRYQRIRGAA